MSSPNKKLGLRGRSVDKCRELLSVFIPAGESPSRTTLKSVWEKDLPVSKSTLAFYFLLCALWVSLCLHKLSMRDAATNAVRGDTQWAETMLSDGLLCPLVLTRSVAGARNPDEEIVWRSRVLRETGMRSSLSSFWELDWMGARMGWGWREYV